MTTKSRRALVALWVAVGTNSVTTIGGQSTTAMRSAELQTSTSRDGKVFSPRARLPINREHQPGHPQLTLTADGGAAIVVDEIAGGARRVLFTRVSRSGAFQPPQILSGDDAASHPVMVRSASDLLVAWTSRSGKSGEPSQIRIKRVC